MNAGQRPPATLARFATVLMLSFVSLATDARAQPPTAGTLAEAFAHAWNTHDVQAFGQLYVADADWVTVAGVRHKGRVAIEAALGQEHATWADGTTLRVSDALVRDIDADHSVVIFTWEITGIDRSGTGPWRGSTLMIATRENGRWAIIAGQVASAPPPK